MCSAPGSKVCCRCRELKEVSQFSIETRTYDGLCSRCRVCDKAYRKWRRGYVKRLHAAMWGKNLEKEAEDIHQEHLAKQVKPRAKRPPKPAANVLMLLRQLGST